MTIIAAACLLILTACMMACVYRIVIGPHAIDRLLAFDLLGVLIAVSLGVFAIIQRSWIYLETSMGLAVLAFVGTMAIAHYVEKRRIF